MVAKAVGAIETTSLPFHFVEIIASPSHVTQIDAMLLCICLSQYTKRILKFSGITCPLELAYKTYLHVYTFILPYYNYVAYNTFTYH